MGGAFVLAVGTTQDDDDPALDRPANLLPVTVKKPVGGEEPAADGAGRGGGGREGAKAGGGAESALPPGPAARAGGTGTGIGTGGGRGRQAAARWLRVRPRPCRVSPPRARPGASRWSPTCSPPRSRRACRSTASRRWSALGPDGEPMRRMIDDIAFRLQMGKPCYFAARFCLQAARASARPGRGDRHLHHDDRTARVYPAGARGQRRPRADRLPAVASPGRAVPAPPRRRRAAAAQPGLADMRTYESPEHWPKVQGGWMRLSASWNLHFLETISRPAIKAAVGQIFVAAARPCCCSCCSARGPASTRGSPTSIGTRRSSNG